MLKKSLILLVIFGLLVAFTPVLAGKPDFFVSVTNPAGNKTLWLPDKAVQVAPGVFSLGQARDPGSGKIVEGYAYVHYKDNTVRGGNPAKPGKAPACYSFLARGAKWRVVEPWVVNPAASGLPDTVDWSVLGNLTKDIAKWEDAADDGVMNNSTGVDILGDGTPTTTPLVADTQSPDNQNEVYFDLLSPGTIAITIVWGIFGGPTFARELVEWDQVYNTYYAWSGTEIPDLNKMDFENIATHELGHSVGMDDLYTSSCSLETMYGYADFGEIIKRDLHNGDIAGVSALY